ncbi:MAG: hypothetical protein ACK5HS_05275 [Mycoplasmatales bacterium]
MDKIVEYDLEKTMILDIYEIFKNIQYDKDLNNKILKAHDELEEVFKELYKEKTQYKRYFFS